jgi:hypothetical protein
MNFTAAEKAFITAWVQERARLDNYGPANSSFPAELDSAYIHVRMGTLAAALVRSECRPFIDVIGVIGGEKPDNVVWPWASLEEWEARYQEARRYDSGEASAESS